MARKWTETQEQIIIKEAEATPDHLRDAFRRAADQIGRSADAVVVRYYNHILKRNNENIQPNKDARKSIGGA